jgi:nickel/cobalt transporter (NicO) family protein
MLRRRCPSLALVAALALPVLGLSSLAAQAASPLGIGTAEPSFDTSGLFGGVLLYVNYYQQSFYRALTGALGAMRQDPHELWMLLALSFAYGVFHAAGPGHGKAVISSYMLANETALRRGIAISFVSSLLQGAVAMAVVGLAYFLLRGTGITLTRATNTMEIASYAMVAVFGAWMLIKKLRMIRIRHSATSALFAASGYPASLHFDAAPAGSAARSPIICADCGQTHLPSVERVGAADFSLGLRPCSGALLVLTFALLNGLYLGGALAVLAMSFGTAMTVSALAILAVGAKGVALRITGRGTSLSNGISHAFEIAGALFVLLLGLLLLAAALHP